MIGRLAYTGPHERDENHDARLLLTRQFVSVLAQAQLDRNDPSDITLPVLNGEPTLLRPFSHVASERLMHNDNADSY